MFREDECLSVASSLSSLPGCTRNTWEMKRSLDTTNITRMLDEYVCTVFWEVTCSWLRSKILRTENKLGKLVCLFRWEGKSGARAYKGSVRVTDVKPECNQSVESCIK